MSPPPDLTETVLEMVRETRNEMREGFKTLYGALAGVRSEIATVRDAHSSTAQRVAKLEGIQQGESAFPDQESPTGTGRHRAVQPSRPELVIPTPEPGSTVEVKYGHAAPSRKSESSPPVVGLIVRSLKSKIARKIAGGLLALALPLLGALAHRLLAPPVEHTVYVPAPATNAAR